MGVVMVAGFRMYFEGVDIEIRAEDNEIVVSPVWRGVDRPCVGGFALSNTNAGCKLAARLKACMESGAAFTGIEKRADVNGKTYISATIPIRGRCMNADLKRLGY